MRDRKAGGFVWMAMFALLAGPVRSAAECVIFEGLEHCSIGEGRLSLDSDEGLTISNIQNGSGVSISLTGATNWTGTAWLGTSHDLRQEALLTAVAEGAATSTATLGLEMDRVDLGATFTGSGDASTFSVFIYRDGVLQAGLGGLENGTIGAISIGGGPGCRPAGQTENECRVICQANGWPCGYCSTPCRFGFGTLANSACQWQIAMSVRSWRLSDGTTVEGDTVVLTEEVGAAASYPYLNFDEIQLQGTVGAATFISESVVRP